MASFPASLAFDHLESVTEAGAITPTHGGMVQGHEFDLPISQKNLDTTPTTAQAQASQRESAGTPTHPQAASQAQPAQAVPRRTTTATKPRPVSMPPQPYSAPTERPDRQRADDGARHASKTDSTTGNRSRSSYRILGDYTLSKTLGAGSMGKVKLAHHNVTGEKVRWICSELVCLTHCCQSLRSKFFPAFTPEAGLSKRAVLRQLRSRPRRMPRRRSAPSARRRFPCSFTTRTSAECER